MASLKYDVDVDLSDSNNSHSLMVQLVGANKAVLDVGCATGYLARALAAQGCVVSGLERDADAAARAAPDLAKLVVGDLEATDLVQAFGERQFDAVVFGDVLEHLRDPLAVLRQSRRLLVPGGSVVASVPNVAHGSVRLALLAGRFDYQPLGLLDETHLRFFTRASLEKLVRQAGLVPVDVRRTTAELFDTHVDVDVTEVAPGVLDAVMADPEALTYQFVLRAVVDDGDVARWELHDRAQAQRDRITLLERELAATDAGRREASTRVDELVARVGELEAAVERLAAELDAAHTRADQLLSSRTMRYTGPLRTAYAAFRRIAGR